VGLQPRHLREVGGDVGEGGAHGLGASRGWAARKSRMMGITSSLASSRM
jgi:aconitase A